MQTQIVSNLDNIDLHSALLAKRLAERKEKAAAIKASHKKYVLP